MGWHCGLPGLLMSSIRSRPSDFASAVPRYVSESLEGAGRAARLSGPAISAESYMRDGLSQILALLPLVTLLSGCSALPRLEAVPEAQTESAYIAGIPYARVWLDRDINPFIEAVNRDSQREAEALREAGKPTDPMPPAHALAISGGGDAGAF